MRQILFRGKAINLHNGSKDFVYGQYVQNRNGKMIYSDTWEDGIQKHYVIEETVGQYTGLTDANGIKIFEGDIHCNENNNKKFVVKFGHFYDEELLDDMYGWYMEDNWGNRFGLNGSEYEYANIIGNIYDNPELISN